VVPNHRAAADFDHAIAFPIPTRHGQALPGGLPAVQNRPQGGQPLAFLTRAAVGTGETKRGRFVESGIQTQAGDDRNSSSCDRLQPFPGGKGAIGHDHQCSIRQPTLCLKNHLPGPIQHGLMAPPVFQPVTLTRSQTRQERQGPRAGGPGYGGQQHQAHPTQPAGLDEVRVRAAHGIPIDPFRPNPLAPAALDRIIDAQHNRTGGHKALDQQPQQKATRFPALPASAVQHAMVVHKAALPSQSHDAQATRDGPLARGQ
jgi:hypothetical protein